MCPISSDNMQAYVLLLNIVVCSMPGRNHKSLCSIGNTVRTYKKLSAIHFSFSYILETMYDSLTWLNQLFLYISFQVFLVTGCRHPLLRNLYYRPQLRTQFKPYQTGPGTRFIAFYSVYRENDHTCVYMTFIVSILVPMCQKYIFLSPRILF